MTGVAIADGDWVVVRRQPDADSGDIVAAMLESGTSADREATVKTLKKADGHVWLIPANPIYSPILAPPQPPTGDGGPALFSTPPPSRRCNPC